MIQIILLFIRVSAEKSLDRTAAQRRRTTTPPYQATDERNFASNGAPVFRNASAGSPRTHYVPVEKTVPQSPHTVPQQNTENYADSVIEVCRQAIQRDLANFSNRQADNATVARRIHAALNKALDAMRAENFNPSYKIGLKLYNYVQDKVWPTLNEVGHPYEHQQMFTHRLYAVCTQDTNA